MKTTAFALALITSAFALSASAGDFGFSAGDSFTSTRLAGGYWVTCSQGNNHQAIEYHSCYDNVLEPREYDRFAGQVDADHVTLTATHEDGSTQTKKASFNPKTGMSEQVNLWVATLFQRPLLHGGVNHVSYNFVRKGLSVSSGELNVTVSAGANRNCRVGSYYRPHEPCGASDCRGYFVDQNFCR